MNLVFFANNERACYRPNIWVMCKPQITSSAQMIRSSDQFVAVRTDGKTLVFVHASNNYIKHRSLWNDLGTLSDPNICVIGDFNVVLGAHERSSGIIHMLHLRKNFVISLRKEISLTLRASVIILLGPIRKEDLGQFHYAKRIQSIQTLVFPIRK